MGISQTYSAVGGSTSVIKTTQEVTGQVTSGTQANITVTSVNSSLTMLYGSRDGESASDAKDASVFNLSSPTNLQLTRTGNSGTSAEYKISVVEYNPDVIQSIQRGTFIASAASVNANITAVNTTKAYVVDAGFRGSNASQANTGIVVGFNSGTSIYGRGAGGVITNFDYRFGYQVVEFK